MIIKQHCDFEEISCTPVAITDPKRILDSRAHRFILVQVLPCGLALYVVAASQMFFLCFSDSLSGVLPPFSHLFAPIISSRRQRRYRSSTTRMQIGRIVFLQHSDIPFNKQVSPGPAALPLSCQLESRVRLDYVDVT